MWRVGRCLEYPQQDSCWSSLEKASLHTFGSTNCFSLFCTAKCSQCSATWSMTRICQELAGVHACLYLPLPLSLSSENQPCSLCLGYVCLSWNGHVCFIKKWLCQELWALLLLQQELHWLQSLEQWLNVDYNYGLKQILRCEFLEPLEITWNPSHLFCRTFFLSFLIVTYASQWVNLRLTHRCFLSSFVVWSFSLSPYSL